MSVTYIVDDQDPAIEYLCPVQHQTVRDNYLHNTYTTIDSVDCGGGWFKYTFNGTSVRVSNRLKPVDARYAVQVDISPMLQRSGNGVYESPELADGSEHSIVYAIGNQSFFPAFDYLTVTAGQSTQLRGRTIIVDDADPAMEYSGNWRNEPITPPAMNFDYTSSPYRDTTHWSNTVGDSVNFTFEGTSVTVYGIIPASNATIPNRNLTATYSIDDGQRNSLSLSPGSTEGRPIAMTELLRSGELAAGKHTMVFTVTDIPNLSLSGVGIDFVTYNASFDNLSSIGAGTPSTAGAISDGHIPVWKPVLGAVLGLLALLVAGLLGSLYWRKRKQSKAQAKATSKVFVVRALKDHNIVNEKDGKAGSLTPDV
ncbi:hypothetical protein E1B28_012419 [Marasmius oreades]|uniref:Uncharacterized protein n=1 Tax=Marasmius oreades TaxID=181124 RepID=A0A9P7RRM1_9AGAR|nr:uncharacterized protein E1B28_012419 [Marasmius oreades]KAG7088425.1 hypothetical protein E1B28_012419 [Marasmius oreades]